MALKGRAGQRFSQAPHPIHRSVSTTGMRMDCSSSGSLGTIWMAPDGQWRAQLPHVTPSVSGIQFFFTHTACPICTDDFSSFVTRRMAPVGHTSEQRVHSGRQYPRSYDISGCISFVQSVEGRSTSLGHADTQSWQAVQCCARWRALHEPAGVSGVALSGFCFCVMAANPPSTFFSCAFIQAVPVSSREAERNPRRLADAVPFASSGVGFLLIR